MDTDHTSGYGKTSEDIVGRCHQALGIVASSFILEATMGIELLSDLLCGRKIVLGAIEGNDRHPMPKIGRITGKEAVGQFDGLLQDVTKDGPGNLLASSTESASVHLLSIGPQSASPGTLEEFTRFDVHSLALSTGGKGENEGDELVEGKLSVAGEILG